MTASHKLLVKTAILLCVGVVALVFGSAVRGENAAGSARALIVELKAKHGSAVSGTARITAVRRGVQVVLRLSGPVPENSPAHIHTGPCRREPTFANPRIANGLISISRGGSVTRVASTTLRRLRASRHSINVHDPNTLGVIACGDIPRAS